MNPAVQAPPKRRYTIAVCKGAAMIDETRRLVEQWQPGESLDDFAHRVQGHDLLGKATACRTRDLVRRVFAPRFLRPTDKPARMLKGILEAGLPSRTFAEMLFLFAARHDPLIYDFTCREYWPAARRGRTVLGTDSVLSFLSEAIADGRLVSPWSEKVAVRVARGVLGTLRDVGLLRESRRGHREILPFRLSDEGAALLARDLHEAGATDSALCSHPDWGLFGLGGSGAPERLEELGESRSLLLQRAGSVVRFTWFVNSIEEMIDALAR